MTERNTQRLEAVAQLFAQETSSKDKQTPRAQRRMIQHESHITISSLSRTLIARFGHGPERALQEERAGTPRGGRQTTRSAVAAVCPRLNLNFRQTGQSRFRLNASLIPKEIRPAMATDFVTSRNKFLTTTAHLLRKDTENKGLGERGRNRTFNLLIKRQFAI
jgi:hypothetical protein